MSTSQAANTQSTEDGVISQLHYRDIFLSYLEADDIKALAELMLSMHPADIADVIAEFSKNDRDTFFQKAKQFVNAEVLAAMNSDLLEVSLTYFSTKELVSALELLESDDAVAVLEDLDHTKQQYVLRGLDIEKRKKLRASLTFDEDTAGRLMQFEVPVISDKATVREALALLRHGEGMPDVFFDVYLVDSKGRLAGRVRMCDLMRTTKMEQKLQDITAPFFSIQATTDQEDVALMFKKYALVSAPVVNEKDQILGMITVDDVVHVIGEEADEDLRYLGGVIEGNAHIGVLQESYSRLKWLVVTLFNTLIASSVLYQFEEVLSHNVALAILMPIVASMGGNAGMQVVTIMVRRLGNLPNNQSMAWSSIVISMLREIRLSVMSGTVLAVILALIASLWFSDVQLGVVLGAAMLFNMLWAGVAGTMLPAILQKFKFDPAIGAGPLMSTTTDVMGFTFFLGLAQLFLL